tara:strand:- start:1183 stop:1317 length:135 start_codon:yes stop_codon:yes gene_type:complete
MGKGDKTSRERKNDNKYKHFIYSTKHIRIILDNKKKEENKQSKK